VPEEVPQLIPLPTPRAFTGEYRALLEIVLAAPNVRGEVRAQAKSARVVSACDCGCRSVGVEPDEAAPSAPYEADAVSLTADGTSPTGTRVEVTLHVVFGRMTELEIWDGGLTQGVSNGELPDVKTLRHRET
jgi:hypothetical protein